MNDPAGIEPAMSRSKRDALTTWLWTKDILITWRSPSMLKLSPYGTFGSVRITKRRKKPEPLVRLEYRIEDSIKTLAKRKLSKKLRSKGNKIEGKLLLRK